MTLKPTTNVIKEKSEGEDDQNIYDLYQDGADLLFPGKTKKDILELITKEKT